ncbi:MAG: DUF116 domain-containing protein [Anaerolineales bacterium]|nr:DUF116 domain-containing protein [Anaerolineales bacterium]
MTRLISYTLCRAEANSDLYYQTIAAFADAWLAAALPLLADLADGYRFWRSRRRLPERSPASCAFDLLVVGVLLREHGQEFTRLPDWGERALGGMVDLQERWPRLEAFIKLGRGLVYRLARLSRWQVRESRMQALRTWLTAVGEAGQARRLGEWHDFFREADCEGEALERCRSLADAFADFSLPVLGQYTGRVETYLAEEAPRHRWRYDAALLERTRLEYHLGMLGSEILNRQYRRDFLAAERRVVILPPCMRARLDGGCEAVATSLGMQCAACTPNCRIHQVTKLGEKHGFAVFIIPDELRVFGAGGGPGQIPGVVGVSCVLTNWTGGWDTEQIGIPAQGVLLDYVGCSYHWDERGFPTDINLRKLMEVLGQEEEIGKGGK